MLLSFCDNALIFYQEVFTSVFLISIFIGKELDFIIYSG